MSFVGSFPHSLDAKKRVFIPAKFREELGAEFYITRKFDPYLSIYTAEEWEEFVTLISSLPESEAAELQDYLLGAAQKCTPDGSGRILLDDKLIDHARINKNATFVGAGNVINIWSEELWAAREASRDLEGIRALLQQHGL